MTWGEAIRLAGVLTRDPSSAIAAALAGWAYPITHEALALYDLFDVTVIANSDSKKGRPKPHAGRPFKMDDRSKQKYGNTGGRSRAEVVEILNSMGHNLPV